MTINVTAVADNPVAGPDEVTINEDSNWQELPDILLVNDSDPDGTTPTFVGIVGGSGVNGTVSFGTPPGQIRFSPTPNFHGIGSFQYTITDGALQGTGTVTVTINSINDAPAGTDNGVTTTEDTPYTFSAVDFGFTDPNDTLAPNTLAGVRISTLPLVGNLQVSGVNVSAGQVISAANITAGNFKVVPPAQASGTPLTSFNFQVQDSGPTGGGNANLDPDPDTMTINVTPVNDAPVGQDHTVTTLEDTAKVFSAADFPFSDPNDTPPNALHSVIISGTAGLGTLTLGGSPLSLPQAVTAAQLVGGELVFAPAANGNGTNYASFTFQVRDNGGGTDTDPVARTMTIDVTSVNDAPSGTDNAVASLEDGSKVFATNDFGFTDTLDTPANTLLSVIMVNKTGGGTLALNGFTVTNGQEILATAIGAGQLVFTPAAGLNGAGYASFTFQVRDNGGTDNGGINLDSTANTMTINVTPVNDPPIGANSTVNGIEDTTYTFTVGNFPFSDATDSPVNTFLAVKITTLPALGTLTLNSAAVSAGQIVTVADITGSLLKFAPAVDANGTPYSTFTFQVQDNGGILNGGVDTDPTPNSMTINVTAVNDPPEGTDKTLTTLEDTPITLVEADFGYTDPKDVPPNPFSQVKITSLPALGSLTWNNLPVDVDDFVTKAALAAGFLKYTPPLNANGPAYTSFTFVVFDGTPLGDLTPNTITINVTAVNDVPVANAQAQSVNEDVAKAITLTGSDLETAPGALVYSIVSAPTHGVLTGTPPNVTYTPTLNYYGSDSFTFRVFDGTAFSAPATVSITVNPMPDNPVGVADTYYFNTSTDTVDPINTTLVVSVADGVLKNDSDPDGGTLTADKLSDPTKGTLTFNEADGSFTYNRTSADPDTTDSFTYRVADGTGRFSGTITVTIDIDLVPPPMAAWVLPVAQYDGVYSGPDETLELRVSHDGVADVNRVEFWWYDHVNQQKYIFIASDATATPSGGKFLYSVMFDTSVLPISEDIQVWVRTYDTAGNLKDRITNVNPPVYARLLFTHTGNSQIFLPLVVK